MVACTWDPSNIGSNITLSNGNKTWTSSSATQSSGRATLGYTCGAGGLSAAASPNNLYLYFEVTAVNANWAAVGLCVAGQPVSSGLGLYGSGFVGFGYYNNGTVYSVDTGIATYASFTTGAVIGVAVDTFHQKLWFTLNGTTWNNDTITNQNPATNTGGLSSYVNYLMGNPGDYATIFPAFGSYDTGASMSGNFSGSFTYAVPSGFTAWAPSASGQLFLPAGLI